MSLSTYSFSRAANLRRDLTSQSVFAGALATCVGFASSFAMAAFRDDSTRLAAAGTFLAPASVITLWGISGAFWRLMIGLAMLLLTRPLKL